MSGDNWDGALITLLTTFVGTAFALASMTCVLLAVAGAILATVCVALVLAVVFRTRAEHYVAVAMSWIIGE